MAAALMLFAGACTDSIKYDPAELYQGDEVYFDIEEVGQLDIETDATSVPFHLYRVDTSKDITVGLESSVLNPSGEDVSAIFGVPTQVTFPAGQNVIEVPVSIVFSAVTAEMDYTMTVKIAGEDQTPYGATMGVFTLKYGTKYEPWVQMLDGAPATFQMAGLWDYLYDAPVEFRKSINMTHLEQYRIEDPFSDVDWFYTMTVNHNVLIDPKYLPEGTAITDPLYLVTMETINTGVNVLNKMPGIFKDAYTFFADYYKAKGREFTYENILNNLKLNEMMPPCINEKTGEIYLNLITQTPDIENTLNSYTSASGIQMIQLPGFKKPDLALEFDGTSIDATGAEKVRFALYKNDDTPEMKYGMYEGTLTDEEIAAKAQELVADEDVEAITDNTATVTFTLEPGDYTLVLAGIDAGTVVKSKGLHYTYAPANFDGFYTAGTAAYTEAFLCSVDNETYAPTTIECEYQTSTENPDVIRLKNPYRAWAEATEHEDMLMDGNYYLTLNIKDKNLVYIEPCNLGVRVNPFEGAFYAYSKAAEALAGGMKPATVKLRKLNGKMAGNTITFPTSTLLVATQSILPNYMDANTLANFKVVLTPKAEGAAIRGTVTTGARASRTAAISDAEATASEMMAL